MKMNINCPIFNSTEKKLDAPKRELKYGIIPI